MKNKFQMNKENAFIIILMGILCLVVVWPSSGTTSKNEAFTDDLNNQSYKDSDSDLAEDALNVYIENQEIRLKNILMQIEGAGEVQVMIRASASKEYVVEKDIALSNSSIAETDSEGGTHQSNETDRTETSLYTKDSNGNDIPWIIKEIEPTIEGVLVAAQGGNQNQVASEITEAVQVLFDIPVHKIKVVKMKVE